jgi:hypothetical protein
MEAHWSLFFNRTDPIDPLHYKEENITRVRWMHGKTFRTRNFTSLGAVAYVAKKYRASSPPTCPITMSRGLAWRSKCRCCESRISKLVTRKKDPQPQPSADRVRLTSWILLKMQMVLKRATVGALELSIAFLYAISFSHRISNP